MAKTDNKEKQRIITPEFRVSYPHILKATQVQGKGDFKFSITMLFKKTQDLSVIKLALKHAKIDAFGPDKDSWPDGLMSPIGDGDSAQFADKEGYAGHWIVKATSNAENKPGLVDSECEPILNAADFYPGCYARAQVFARVWEYMGKRGVHFILDHVQKTRDGKSMSGKKAASEVFGPIAGAQGDADDEIDDANDRF